MTIAPITVRFEETDHIHAEVHRSRRQQASQRFKCRGASRPRMTAGSPRSASIFGCGHANVRLSQHRSRRMSPGRRMQSDVDAGGSTTVAVPRSVRGSRHAPGPARQRPRSTARGRHRRFRSRSRRRDRRAERPESSIRAGRLNHRSGAYPLLMCTDSRPSNRFEWRRVRRRALAGVRATFVRQQETGTRCPRVRTPRAHPAR